MQPVREKPILQYDFAHNSCERIFYYVVNFNESL